MLADGVLRIEILDQGETMDTALYVELIEDKFEDLLLLLKTEARNLEKTQTQA